MLHLPSVAIPTSGVRPRASLVLAACGCLLALVLASAGRAGVPPGTITSYSDPSINDPEAITAGPDGALWFTNFYRDSIGRITTAGTVTTYADVTVGRFNRPWGIAAGPDGALWFTNYYGESIGRITTSGTVTIYGDATIQSPSGITSGPDGALWFTNHDGNSIGRITTDGTVTRYTDASINGPDSITTGPDGALWFTNSKGNSIGRITTGGTVTRYTDASINDPESITTGPDGALWFSNSKGNSRLTNSNNSIGRITTGGTVTSYTDATIHFASGITTGPDGALWFTNYYGDSIGRIQVAAPPPFTSAPALTSTSQEATFAWTTPLAIPFTCSLDSAPYVPCTSPRTYHGLAAGRHTFCIQANGSPPPDCTAWTIVSPGKPVVSIAGVTVSGSAATVSFTADQLAPRFTCSLDGAAYKSCSSPLTYHGLASGLHTVSVLATNFASDTSAAPALQAFAIP